MSKWPDWHPPKEMIARQPYLPRFTAGGEGNPMGARALYLGNTRISHPRHQSTVNHRPFRVVWLHPPHERRRGRPLQPRKCRDPRSRSAGFTSSIGVGARPMSSNRIRSEFTVTSRIVQR